MIADLPNLLQFLVSQKVIRDADCRSEMMPDCWNDDSGHYSLRYALGEDLYILKCLIIDGSTSLFNLYNATNGTVSNVSFELRDVISYCANSTRKKLVELMPKIDVHITRIRQDLIMPVAGCNQCTDNKMPRRLDPTPSPKCCPNQLPRNNYGDQQMGNKSQQPG